MSGTQLLRVLVNERLAAAANEIFGLVEKTIVEYQDEVVRSKREIIQLRQQLNVLQPQIRLHRQDPQQVSEVFPSLQQHSDLEQISNLMDQEIQAPPQIKEEQVDQDLCIIPESEAGTSNSATIGLAQSEPTTDCQLFPSYSAITVSVNDDAEDDWNGSEDLGSISSNEGQADAVFMDQEQAHKEEKDCRFCGKKFKKDSDLIRHVYDRHTGEKAFKCPECEKEFARRDHLAVHLRIHTGEKPHICRFCGKKFAQSSNLNVHMRTHTVPQQLIEEMFSPKHDWSPILEEQKVQEPLLPQVKEEVEELGVFQGLEGGPSVSRNIEHKQSGPTAEGRPLLSDGPGANTERGEGWEATGNTQLSLTPSSQSHAAPSHVDSVSVSHLGSREETTDYHCVVCGTELESRESLTDHLQTHTDVRFCHVCGSCFGRDIDLVRHVDEMHPGEKPFKCHECGKVFGRREHLTMHSRVHTGERPYQCPFCDKSFTQSAYLCVHKRTHTGEKPYCCSVCGKRFYTSSALKNCMKYHTGDRSFHCQYCGKAFYTNTHLQVHIRVHTGSKPFHCPICHRHFAHQTTVKNHMKTHINKTQMKQRTKKHTKD